MIITYFLEILVKHLGFSIEVFTELPCSWSAPGQQGTAPWRATPAELHVKEALEKGGQLLMVQKSGINSPVEVGSW